MAPIFPLLGLLAGGDRHGYELKAWADANLDPFWRIDFGQLYRTLQRAVDDGWIVSVDRQKAPRGPERRPYRLTPAGQKVLAQWLGEPAADADEVLVKLRLAARGDAAQSAAALGRIVGGNRQAVAASLETARTAYRMAVDARDHGAILLREHVLRRCEALASTLELARKPVPRSARAPTAGDRAGAKGALRVAGSDDPLLAWLAREAGFAARIVGSYGGLWSLQRHRSDAASMHLLDPQTNEYNLPFLEQLFPEDELVLVNIAWRDTGLIVARGNPKSISGVAALADDGLRFINRQREAGTRQLLARRLREAGVDPKVIRGWDHCASTHEAVARAITLGTADVGPGLRAVAAAWGLDFLPLAHERYDLAMPRSVLASDRFRPLRAALRSRSFRRQGANLAGYDLRDSGRIVGQAAPPGVGD